MLTYSVLNLVSYLAHSMEPTSSQKFFGAWKHIH